MRNKNLIVLEKIMGYCNQIEEACEMFQNDYNKFVNISVFKNACCMCILQVGELSDTPTAKARWSVRSIC